jgi:hypothetical protein
MSVKKFSSLMELTDAECKQKFEGFGMSGKPLICSIPELQIRTDISVVGNY